MSLYPESVARCQHIKVNGRQCGSPALRNEKYCYFHMRWALKSMEINESHQRERWNATLALPEDADSIQMGLGEVIRLMMTRRVDHRTAALTLYALQTASANLKRTSFEPEPTQVVIDPECVGQRPIGATAWSAVEGREYDEITETRSDESDGAEDDLTQDAQEKIPYTPKQKEFWRGIGRAIEQEKALKRQEAEKRQLLAESPTESHGGSTG
jgi:hypothetical protein